MSAAAPGVAVVGVPLVVGHGQCAGVRGDPVAATAPTHLNPESHPDPNPRPPYPPNHRWNSTDAAVRLVLLLPSGPPDPLHQPKRQHPGNEVIHHEPELDSGFAGSRLADGRSGNRRSAPLTGRPRRPTQQPGPAGSASQPGYCSG